MKVSVIGGAGAVGSSCVFNLAREDAVDEVVVVDIDEERAQGEAYDVERSVLLEHSANVAVGGYDDIRDASAVLVTASAAVPGDLRDRSQMIDKNKALTDEIFTELSEAVDCPIVTATSPTDVLNMVARRSYDIPREHLLGYNLNDTLRFRWAIAEHENVDSHAVEAYVLGEHGDTQVPVFSNARIDGDPTSFTEAKREAITERALDVAWETFELKGETPRWSTGYGLALIARAICTDEGRLLPCSVQPDGAYSLDDVSVGLPVRVGERGIKEIVEFDLSPEEREALDRSATTVRNDFDGL